MAKFCGKCGSKLDEITGLCQNCAKETKTDSLQSKNKTAKDNHFNQIVNDAGSTKKKLSKKEIKDTKKAEGKQAKKDKKKAKRAAMSTGQKIRGVLKVFVGYSSFGHISGWCSRHACVFRYGRYSCYKQYFDFDRDQTRREATL